MIKSALVSPITKMVVGSGLGQLISLALLPLITRLYPPELFGEVAIISTTAAFALNLLFWQFERLIVISPDQELGSLLRAIVKIGLLASLIMSLCIVGLSFLDFGSYSKLSPNLYFLFWPFLLLLGFLKISRLLATRQKAFGAIGKSNVFNSAVSSGAKVGIGFLSVSTLGFLISEMLGNLFSQLAYRKVWRDLLKMREFKSLSIRELFRLHRGFFLPNQISTLMNSVAALLPIQFVSSVYGLKEAGLFSVAYRIAALPQVHIGAAKGDYYSGQFAEFLRLKDHQGFVHFFKRNLLRDLAMTVFIYGLMAVVSPSIFPLIFGKNWVDGGSVVSVFSMWLGSAFFVVPYSNLLILLKKQRLKFYYEIFNLIVLGSVFLFYLNQQNGDFFLWLSLGQMLTYLVYFGLICLAVKSVNQLLNHSSANKV